MESQTMESWAILRCARRQDAARTSAFKPTGGIRTAREAETRNLELSEFAAPRIGTGASSSTVKPLHG
jgi:deoxyribose-phosphate aldolase